MAKKIKDGLIMQGFRNLANRFSPEAEKYARYKIQKQKGTYDDKTPSYPEPVYREPTEQEKKNMKKGFDTPKDSKPTKPRKKQKTASSVTKAGLVDLKDQIKISGPEKDLKKRPNITKEDREKLDRLQKMKDRADKRQARKDRSTERLAFRMGEKATFQDAAALKQKRKQARKDYLRNFASQLARGEQATPRTGFGQGEGNPNANTSLADNSPKGTDKEVNNNTEVAKSEATAIKNTLKPSGDNKFLNNNFTNFNSAAEDILADVMNTNINLTSPNNKIEDSTPITYMQKEYRKKRGY
tara:strand:+ start:67 stop:960 length:894 start_codon:yes stop_codon:yes gene_type:complete